MPDDAEDLGGAPATLKIRQSDLFRLQDEQTRLKKERRSKPSQAEMFAMAWDAYEASRVVEVSQNTAQPQKSPSNAINSGSPVGSDTLRRIGKLADEIKELARGLSGESGANQEGSGGREGAGSIAAAAVERARTIRDRAPGGEGYTGGAESGVREAGASPGKRKRKVG